MRGSIIHISSQMGHVGGARRTVYCMSKHGIEGLTKAMAIDLAPHGIRVNTIGPTFIDTPLTRPFWNDRAFHDDVLRRIKLGRLGTVEDLMGAVVFLASDAAALVTGTVARRRWRLDRGIGGAMIRTSEARRDRGGEIRGRPQGAPDGRGDPRRRHAARRCGGARTVGEVRQVGAEGFPPVGRRRSRR